MKDIYSVFYFKLPQSKRDVLPGLESKMVTFLNPYYLEIINNNMSDIYKNFNYICSDGILPVWLNRFWHKKKTERISFDMSSLAKDVFENASINNKSVYFVGADLNSINNFANIVKFNYPSLHILGWHHGYINNQFTVVAKEILALSVDIVVVGMGAPLQDEFAVYLKNQGFCGTIYTCGGFFHQTTKSMYYYPKWINKLNLRYFYRMFKEPYVLKRVLKYYPIFIFNYSRFLSKM